MAAIREKRISEFVQQFKVKPDSKVTLAKDFDPRYKKGLESKQEGRELLAQGIGMLAEYQTRLYAEGTHGVLIVLQALDAAGKDGTIRHVMSGVNPQGVAVHSFKVPSSEELDHDYLWRYAKNLPARGQIGIFNRSHYEEVLVVRVHKELLERQKLPKEARDHGIWKRRYREINDWERSSSTCRRRSSESGSCAGSTSPTTTGSSRRPTCRSAATGTTTRLRSRRCSRTRARSGPPGM